MTTFVRNTGIVLLGAGALVALVAGFGALEQGGTKVRAATLCAAVSSVGILISGAILVAATLGTPEQ